MKRLIIIIFVLSLASNLFSETNNEFFSKANELYKNNRYREALEFYNKIEGINEDWKLYYNIANCYYRLNDFVKAKIFYLKAKKLNGFEKDIDKNIKVVNLHFKDRVSGRREDFFVEAINRIESFISIDFLSIILLVFVFAFNILLFVFIKNRGKKRKIFLYLLIPLFTFSVFSAFYLSYKIKQENRKIFGVVLKDNTILRSGKDIKSSSEIVNAGLDFKITEIDEEWVRVRVSNEIEGWLRKEDIEII